VIVLTRREEGRAYLAGDEALKDRGDKTRGGTMQGKRHIKIRSLLALLAGSLLPAPPVASADASLELYGTFQAMGVVVTVGAADDPDQDAVANVAYRVSGSGAYRPGFPLSRVSSTRFAGSLFWLQAGTTYDVRVTFSDPDGALNGIAVQASAATRAEISVPTPSLSYYVSPTGSGTTCSLASPCALTEGLNQAHAGQAVFLRGGTYYQGELTLPRSGAAGMPIMIQSYPGETATLDGGDLGPFTWTAQGGGVYRTTVTASDPHLVMSDGQRLYPYQSLADLQNLIWGISGFYADGATLYVHLIGNANPGTTTMVVSHYNTAFTVNQDFIYFLDLTFTHYGQGSYAKALYFYNGSDNLVQGCTFAVNDLGIGLKYDSQRNVFQDNTFYDTDFTWPWDAVKAGSELETGGIRMYDPMTGRGTVIRRNTFHDYFDGFGVCPDSGAGTSTNETDVYGNLVYNTGDDGMETDGTCSNVRIWGNTFHDVLVGISLAPVYTGPVYALRNLIYRTGAGNSSYPGSPFKFNSGYDQSGPMYLFHNTADAVLPGNAGLDIKFPGSWTLIYARNNIWAGTEYALSNANPDQPLDLDYDDLYTTLPNELAWWDGLPDRHLNTLAELQTVTNQELHGKSAVPGFANAAGGDYTLDASSQLIDAGVLIPGIDDDFGGAAPDIGAFEFTPALYLHGYPGDGTIRLNWTVNTTMPLTSTWQIVYYSQTVASAITVTGILSPTRAYTLTGLTNHAWYTVTLNALLDSVAFLTGTIRARPTDDWVYLPLMVKN
jgi:hypothetical protein